MMSSDVDDPPASSLSKACFIHKRNKSQKRKLETIPSDLSKRRALYNCLWKTVETKIKEIELSAHHEVITSIGHFVKSSSYYRMSIRNNIPTVALITGVNVPDHASLFNLLADHLHSNVTSHVVTLASKNCSTLTGMIQNTISTIIQNHAQNHGKPLQLKRQNCTFGTLLSWYHELKDCSTKKPNAKTQFESTGVWSESVPIVILFEDLEAFNSRNLQDFILICSNYVEKLPLVLVFGVATTVTAVHNLLPQKASSCLAMETFCMPSATEYLTQVLHKVIMSPSLPFKLGPRVFRLLVDVVLFHDFSIVNLTRMLKFCIMEHFYSNPGAVLCCDTSDLKNQLHNMTSELDTLKELPSFSRYMSTLKHKERQATLSNVAYTKGIIKQLLEKLHNYHKKISVLVECLHVLVKDLPGYPLGKQSREIYVLALEKKLIETEEFQKTFKILKMLSYDELMKRLQSCVTLLQSEEIKSLNLGFCDVAELEKHMENLNKSRGEDTHEDAENNTILPLNLGTMTSRAHLKEKLEMLAQQKKSTKFEICRQEIIAYLESLFRDMIPPSVFPFYEVMYFDSPITVKKHLMTVPRAALQKALTNPHLYLKCNCCELQDDVQALPSMPDICIAYHLYLECGKLINLFDWLQAFKAVKGDKKENRRRVQKNKSNQDSVLQAQFFQAVSELQFLGFIKATSRKTDHVTRLTWSTC